MISIAVFSFAACSAAAIESSLACSAWASASAFLDWLPQLNAIVAAAANAITTNELIDLYYSLRSPYRKRAVWIMNDATVNMIRKLKDGNGQYIWSPGITANDTDTILGRKVYTTTCMPTAKTGAKTVAFGDLDYYWVGDREGISFKRLNELYATKGQVGFLATKRLDARLILPETIKVLKMK